MLLKTESSPTKSQLYTDFTHTFAATPKVLRLVAAKVLEAPQKYPYFSRRRRFFGGEFLYRVRFLRTSSTYSLSLRDLWGCLAASTTRVHPPNPILSRQIRNAKVEPDFLRYCTSMCSPGVICKYFATCLQKITIL